MQPVRPTRQNVLLRPPINGRQTGVTPVMSSRIVSTGTPGLRPAAVRLPSALILPTISTENVGMQGLGEAAVARENGDFNADEMKAKLRAWHVRVKTNKAALSIGGRVPDKGPCGEVTVTTRSVAGALSAVGPRPPPAVWFGGGGTPGAASGVSHLGSESSGGSLLPNAATALTGPPAFTTAIAEKSSTSVVSAPVSFVEPVSQPSQLQVAPRGRSVESFASGHTPGSPQETGSAVPPAASAVSVGSANFSGPLSLSEILKRKKSTKVDLKRTSESLAKELITARPKSILAPRPISQPPVAQATLFSETAFVSSGDGSSGGPAHLGEEHGAGPRSGPLSISRKSAVIVPPPPPSAPTRGPPKLNNCPPLGPPRPPPPPPPPPPLASSSCPVSPGANGSKLNHALAMALPELPAATPLALVSEPSTVTPASFHPLRPSLPPAPSQEIPQKSAPSTLLSPTTLTKSAPPTVVPPTTSTPSLSSEAGSPVPLPSPSLAASTSGIACQPLRKIPIPSKTCSVGLQQKQQQLAALKLSSSGLVTVSPRPVPTQATRTLLAQQPSKRPQLSNLVTIEASTGPVIQSPLTTPPLVLRPIPQPAGVTQFEAKHVGILETQECFAQSKQSLAQGTPGIQDVCAAVPTQEPIEKFEGIATGPTTATLESNDNDVVPLSSAAPIEALPSRLCQTSPEVPPTVLVEPVDPVFSENRCASFPSFSEDEAMPRAVEAVASIDHVEQPFVSCPSSKRVKCTNSDPDNNHSTVADVDMPLSSPPNIQSQGLIGPSLQSQNSCTEQPGHDLIHDLLRRLSLQEASSSGQWLARLVQRATQLSEREPITSTLPSYVETSSNGRSVEELVQRCALAQKVLQLVSSSLTASPTTPHISLKDCSVSLSSPPSAKSQETPGSPTHSQDA